MDERDEVMETEDNGVEIDNYIEVETPSGAPGWLLIAIGAAGALAISTGVKKARKIYQAHKKGKVKVEDIDAEYVEVTIEDDDDETEDD